MPASESGRWEDRSGMFVLRAAGRCTPLLRRTFDAAIGAEDAAIAGFRAENRLTARTFIEELARFCRHHLDMLEAAFGAGDLRFHDYGLNGLHSAFTRSLSSRLTRSRRTRSATLAVSIAAKPT